MRSGLTIPVRGRDIAAGIVLWIGLSLLAWGAITMPGTGGSIAEMLAGAAVIVVSLVYVRPYGRPWPLVQWRAWRMRRASAFRTGRSLSMIVPSLTRSAFGLVIGAWLGARLLEWVAAGARPAPASLPQIAGLLIGLVLAADALLDG